MLLGIGPLYFTTSNATPPKTNFVEGYMIFQNRSKLRGQVGRIGVALATSSPRDAQIGRFWKIVYREHANAGTTISCTRVRAYRR